MPNQTRQPTPGEHLGSIRTALARRGCAFRCNMKTRAPRLTREEVQRKLEAFTEELKAGWEREGLDWAPDLLAMLFEFNREASSANPNWEQLELLREGLWDFFGGRKGRKFLKGTSFVLQYADVISQREPE